MIDPVWDWPEVVGGLLCVEFEERSTPDVWTRLKSDNRGRPSIALSLLALELRVDVAAIVKFSIV